jgi:hypothetical protein
MLELQAPWRGSNLGACGILATPFVPSILFRKSPSSNLPLLLGTANYLRTVARH